MTAQPPSPRSTSNPTATPGSDSSSVAIPLSQLRRGERAILDTRDLPEAESKLLAAMGLGERCEIRVCRAGTPCIVQIHAVRVGIGREVADRIKTTPCGCDGPCAAQVPDGQPQPDGS